MTLDDVNHLQIAALNFHVGQRGREIKSERQERYLFK